MEIVYVVPDLDSVCRLCLLDDSNLVPIFPTTDTDTPNLSPLASSISACVGFEITCIVNFPSKICQKCLVEVQRWLEFRNKCQAINDSLIKVLDDLPSSTVVSENEAFNSGQIDNSRVEGVVESKADLDLDVCQGEEKVANDSLKLSVKVSNTVCDLQPSEEFPSENCQESDCDDNHSDNSDDHAFGSSDAAGFSDLDPSDELGEGAPEEYWRNKATKCPLCQKAFGKYSGVKLHLKNVHTVVKLFPCKACAHISCSSSERKSHILKKHPVGTVHSNVCRICGLFIKRTSSFNRHVRQHEDKLRCTLCGTSCKTDEALIKHKKEIHKEELTEVPPPGVDYKYSCHLCESKTFWRSKDWRDHYLDVHGSRDVHPCKMCSRAYSSAALLAIHERSHTGEKPFMCDQCPTRFSSKCSLRNHMRKHTRKFECQECLKTFSSKQTLGHHMRHHTGEKPYVCHECGKTFSSENGAQFHMRTHTGEMPYSCDKCDFKGRTGAALYAHRVKHTDERPFKCEQCGKGFKMKSWMKEHLKTHSDVRNFICGVCNHAFIANYQLKSHMKTHSGEKPHNCDVCLKAFARRDTLTEHMRTHTREKKYSCDSCQQDFMFLKSFKRHKCYGKQISSLSMQSLSDSLKCND